MDGIYSIGETAKINNISVKALRVYDEMGLLKPKYIDPNNGYRYYTYDQFSYIDKIKRFKNVGMALKELKEIFLTKDLSLIEEFLIRQKDILEEESRKLERKKQSVQWLSDFFEYSKSLQTSDEIVIRHIPKRKIISVPARKGDSMYAMDMQLRNIISGRELKDVEILNPYGYILDFKSLMENKFYPISSTVSLYADDPAEGEYIQTLPDGDYLCCLCKILSDSFDLSFFKKYCIENKIEADRVIAFEYLKSLYDPANSPYELQIFIG